MRLFMHELRAEQLQFWRSRESAIFVFIFPALLFVLLGSVYTGTYHGHRESDVLLAGLIGYGAANTAFAGLGITLVIRREYGILKRVRATPLPAATYVAALLVSTLLVFALQTIVLFALGRFLFAAHLPGQLVSLALVVLLGAAVFSCIGLAATALIRSMDGASAVLNTILLPMAFLSGSFGPIHYPSFLRAIGDVLPLKYLVVLVNAIYLDRREIWSKPGAIAVLLVWGLGALVVAWRRFRWEPQRA